MEDNNIMCLVWGIPLSIAGGILLAHGMILPGLVYGVGLGGTGICIGIKDLLDR